MNIGFVGLGKLGLPVALAVEDKGHTVCGYDINPVVKTYVSERQIPYREEGAQELLDKTQIEVTNLSTVVEKSEIIFVPIQTPHEDKYEGVTRIPKERVDFNYTWLKQGLLQIDQECQHQNVERIVVIISTVLPGTLEPIIDSMSDKCKVCYNPFFIAMGTTVRDFTNPEFVLLGRYDKDAGAKLREFYATIHDRPVHEVGIKEAELTKVAYNTFISTKLSFVNTLMEICHKMKINVDDVTDGLKLADQRLISKAYLSAGMADGGGCHPRDNIALSWLARKLNLSYDFFDAIMTQREESTDWLANLIDNSSKIQHHAICDRRPVYILGKAFKAETNLTVGSPSILLYNLLEERGIDVKMWDPHVDEEKPDFKSGVYFIGTKHEEFHNFEFPDGSTVFDPWRYLKNMKFDSGLVEYIPIGESR